MIRRGRRPWPGRSLRRLSLLAALLAALALAGCVMPGKDGPVVPGPEAGPVPLIDLAPDPPQPDATPQQIVYGFIEAATGFPRNQEVARTFLVDDRAISWRSDKQVTVFSSVPELDVQLTRLDGARVEPAPATTAAAPTDSPSGSPTGSVSGTATGSATRTTKAPPPTAADPTTVDGRTAEVVVRLPVVAVIDDAGRYSPAPPGKRVTESFELAKVAGQWRISRLDDGLLINQVDFASTFRDYAVYFPASTGGYLVPDLRWFPVTTGIATRLVQALLTGPARWLAPAVGSGAPTGTRLAEPAVVVSQGRAVVDLDSAVYKATSAQRRTLQRQLVQTLDQLDGVIDVTITVKKARFDVAGTGGGRAINANPGQQLRVDPPVDPSPLVLDGAHRISRLTGGGLRPRIPEPVAKIDALTKQAGMAPAVAPDGSAFAVLDSARATLWYQAPGAPQASALLHGVTLTSPSFDPQGWVWSTLERNTGVVTAVRPGVKPADVTARWLAGQRILGLRISRDGARALLVVKGAAGLQVLVSGIRRDGDGRPVELAEAMQLAPELIDVTSAAWLDERRVVLLGRTAHGSVLAWISKVGGPTVASTTATGATVPAGANWIAAGNGQLDLYLGTDNGRVLARAGAGWYQVATGRWPTFPG
jgi:hypothetical protein